MFEKLKGLVGGMGARGAVATDTPDELPRMQFAAIAAKVGMPEEKVAMMAQMVRQNGMADAQMGFMMQTATAKGVTCEEIMSMLTSMGVAKSQVVRVMSAQGLMAEDEAQRILDAERAAAERRAAASKTSARKQFARKALIIAFWLVVWELLDHVVDNRLVLAGPIRTLQALADQVVMPNFWMIVGASFGRIALGFLLSFAVGFLLVTIFYRGGSLIPCILAHSAINTLGTFANDGKRRGIPRDQAPGEGKRRLFLECNAYMQEWDFAHWGARYWTPQAAERTDET